MTVVMKNNLLNQTQTTPLVTEQQPSDANTFRLCVVRTSLSVARMVGWLMNGGFSNCV